MSLNWKEVDEVLTELALDGNFVQNIVQPDFSRLYIEVFKEGISQWLHICLKPRLTRLHWDKAPARIKGSQPRFAELLRSRLKGHRIEHAGQIGAERMIRIEAQGSSERLSIVIRLWSNASNILLLDENDIILDAFYRRPGKDETSGKPWVGPVTAGDSNLPEAEATIAAAAQKNTTFSVREWKSTGFESFGSFIAAEYKKKEDEIEFQTILERLGRLIPQTENRLERRVQSLNTQLSEGSKAERFKEMAEMILGNKHRIERGARWLDTDDWYNPGSSLRIELDPKIDSLANAERFFQKYRKTRDAKQYLEQDLAVAKASVASFALLAARLPLLTNLREAQQLGDELAPFFESKSDERKEDGNDRPGLVFSVRGYPIFVGRSAAESDELLRRHVRGNDYWLHIRDRPGGYVFVKVPKGKSIPLDILLDAATLAVWYSKARGEPEVDLFYTQVKHLRRAKHGNLGTVIPTQERNIHLTVEPERVERLRGLGVT